MKPTTSPAGAERERAVRCWRCLAEGVWNFEALCDACLGRVEVQGTRPSGRLDDDLRDAMNVWLDELTEAHHRLDHALCRVQEVHALIADRLTADEVSREPVVLGAWPGDADPGDAEPFDD